MLRNFLMANKLSVLFVFLLILILFYNLHSVSYTNIMSFDKEEPSNIEIKANSKKYIEVFATDTNQYHANCFNLFKKKLNVNSSLVFRPPLRQPPPELMNDF